MPQYHPIHLKRVYEAPASSDGKRVLVDRLWPRGITKAQAAVDVWLKDIAPSTELRKWFAHDPARWEEFQRRYVSELADHEAQLNSLRDMRRTTPVTLLFAAKDRTHNHAVLLREWLLKRPSAGPHRDNARKNQGAASRAPAGAAQKL